MTLATTTTTNEEILEPAESAGNPTIPESLWECGKIYTVIYFQPFMVLYINISYLTNVPADSDPFEMRSRFLLSGLATAGALETGFLSYSKVFDPSVLKSFCTEASCNQVLSGPFSKIPILDTPLVSLAFVAYSGAAALSVLSAVQEQPVQANRPQVETATNALLLGLTSAMATFSGYLMLVLSLVLHMQCNYCLLSAFLSVSMAITAWQSRLVPNITKAFTISSTSSAITAVASAFLFYATTTLTIPEPSEASTAVAAQVLADMETSQALGKKSPPRITTHSSPHALEVADALAKLNAKMYGAYWCSHCYDQKQVFGQEAFEQLEYLECDKQGLNSQFDLCKVKKVRDTRVIACSDVCV